ncbi:uncharacterized protein LOC105186438 [Harpegnathos saltator]|uniref:uncharacterized protein LOC105186438 n=1 Tax=Harpegnathos saltator TaxID=610380 RepID=UPI000DBEE971|nr:uncharacterized protein LOC105186438 [Harpegnathos saltator]
MSILPIMGTTVMGGHKTVQESNVQIEWIDDSIVCEINDDENRDNFPIKYKSQEITQQSVSQQSLSSQDYYSILEENSPEENLNNDNGNNNRKSLKKMETTAL